MKALMIAALSFYVGMGFADESIQSPLNAANKVLSIDSSTIYQLERKAEYMMWLANGHMAQLEQKFKQLNHRFNFSL